MTSFKQVFLKDADSYGTFQPIVMSFLNENEVWAFQQALEDDPYDDYFFVRGIWDPFEVFREVENIPLYRVEMEDILHDIEMMIREMNPILFEEREDEGE